MAILTESRLREIIKEEIEQMGAPEAPPQQKQWVIHMSPRTARNHAGAMRKLAWQFGVDLLSYYPGEFVAKGGDIDAWAKASSDYVKSKRIRAYVGY